MEIYKLLLKIMEERNLSVAGISKICDIPDSTVRGIIKREQKTVALDVAFKLANGLNVSLEYLNGLPERASNIQIPSPDAHSNDLNNIISKYSSLDPYGKETIKIVLDRETARVTALQQKDNQINKLKSSTIIDFSQHTPVNRHLAEYFRDASAGSGIFILGNESAARIAISDSDWDERTDFVIRVNGSSMEPDYMDGENVMVSQRVELNHGDVGIFVVNGKAYIKEYGETELISRNSDSPNIPIYEYDNIVCMGRVIGKLEGEYEIIND